MVDCQLDYRPIDYRDAEMWQQLVVLELNTFPDLTEAKLRHILLMNHSQTLVMGCMDGPKLVGVNGFIAHNVTLNGKSGIAYQSCITATDPGYRGRGVFQGLINHAKELLKAKAESAFIFGYPNHNSGPIFCNKLGFNLRKMVSIDFSLHLYTRFPGAVFDAKVIEEECCDVSRRVQFDARETGEWKASSPNGATASSENYTNFVFGRRDRQVFRGLALDIFRVGGFELNKPPIFNRLIKQAAGTAPMIRLVVPEDSPFSLSRKLVRSNSNSEPLIDFPLNWPSSELKLEAWCGLKDVF